MVIKRDASKVLPSPYAFELTTNPGKPRKVIAFDTETTDGYATLIADSLGNYTDFPTFQNKEDPDYGADALFEWLTQKQYRNTLNFFFNGSYDWNAIIKWLPENEERETLIRRGSVDYGVYRFQFLDKKLLKISRVNSEGKVKNSCSYWDIAQFLSGESLAVQSRHTPVPKDETFDIGNGIDTERYREDPIYKSMVIKYCIQDCKATEYLANRLVKQVYDMGIYPTAWHSKAAISKLYNRYNLKDRIMIPTGNIQQKALNCTRGGLIGCFQMGVFKNVKAPDVRSCYPSIIQNLYSYNGKSTEAAEYIPDAAYSFFKVRIDYNHPYASLLWYPQVSPEKKALREHWHVTGDMEVWITKPEYEYFMNLGYDLKILEGTHILKTPDTHQPFHHIINDLWDLRIEAKKDGNPIQATIKIVMNSIYGMMLNSWDEHTYYTYDRAVEIMQHNGYTSDAIIPADDLFEQFLKIRGAEQKIINGKLGCYTIKHQAGTFYAPFMASHILAGARVKLCSDMQRDIDKGHVISVATDSFSVTKLSSPLDTSNRLGAWEVKSYEKMLQFGAGRYSVSENGVVIPDLSANRSVPLPPAQILDLLYEYWDEESIPFYKSSPVKAKESLSTRYRGKDMMNVFVDKPKDLKLRTGKRHWYEKYNKVGDIFEYNINSRPFDISEMKSLKVI